MNGGNDMRDNPEECQQLCQQTEGCVAFTFTSKGACWLKDFKSQGERKSGAFSGDKYCQGKFSATLK